MKRLEESRTVSIPIGASKIEGDLAVPSRPHGIVVLAHGSGSSRFSSRNQYVAETLNDGHLATLLIDLLTREEELVDMVTSHLRFNIPLLADRLVAATDWVTHHDSVSSLPLGYFGASTGAAAALIAAVERADRVGAIVSRGGRPDLAGNWLSQVKAPTLLIVGELDDVVIELNIKAAAQLHAETQIEIVPGATHLFEEDGALQKVAMLSRDWFERKLPGLKAA